MRKHLLRATAAAASAAMALLLFTACGEAAGRYDAEITEAQMLPPGFTSLARARAGSGDIFSWVAWESQLSFTDLDGVCVYQCGLANSDTLLMHQDEIYIAAGPLAIPAGAGLRSLCLVDSHYPDYTRTVALS